MWLYRGLREPYRPDAPIPNEQTDFTDCPLTALDYAGRGQGQLQGVILIIDIPCPYSQDDFDARRRGKAYCYQAACLAINARRFIVHRRFPELIVAELRADDLKNFLKEFLRRRWWRFWDRYPTWQVQRDRLRRHLESRLEGTEWKTLLQRKRQVLARREELSKQRRTLDAAVQIITSECDAMRSTDPSVDSEKLERLVAAGKSALGLLALDEQMIQYLDEIARTCDKALLSATSRAFAGSVALANAEIDAAERAWDQPQESLLLAKANNSYLSILLRHIGPSLSTDGEGRRPAY